MQLEVKLSHCVLLCMLLTQHSHQQQHQGRNVASRRKKLPLSQSQIHEIYKKPPHEIDPQPSATLYHHQQHHHGYTDEEPTARDYKGGKKKGKGKAASYGKLPYKGKPLKIKPAKYHGPQFGPYDLIAGPGKAGKKTKFGDDPVHESKKGYGHHKEYVLSHFGGFGGGGSIGYIKKGHKKGGKKGGYKSDPHKGGGYKAPDPHKGGVGYKAPDPHHDPHGGGGYKAPDPHHDPHGGGGYKAPDPHHDPHGGGGYKGHDPHASHYRSQRAHANDNKGHFSHEEHIRDERDHEHLAEPPKHSHLQSSYHESSPVEHLNLPYNTYNVHIDSPQQEKSSHSNHDISSTTHITADAVYHLNSGSQHQVEHVPHSDVGVVEMLSTDPYKVNKQSSYN